MHGTSAGGLCFFTQQPEMRVFSFFGRLGTESEILRLVLLVIRLFRQLRCSLLSVLALSLEQHLLDPSYLDTKPQTQVEGRFRTLFHIRPACVRCWWYESLPTRTEKKTKNTLSERLVRGPGASIPIRDQIAINAWSTAVAGPTIPDRKSLAVLPGYAHASKQRSTVLFVASMKAFVSCVESAVRLRLS